ncbi:MAG TPA: hypothetical protein VK610_00210 [Rhodothermales bacterium]|nr:hypothetical protein [Rhodothermales bacterium]
MAGKSSKGGGSSSSKSSGGFSSSRSSSSGSSFKSSPSSPSSQRSSGSSFGSLFSGSKGGGSKSPARKIGGKEPKGGGGFGSWRAPSGGTIFGRSYGQSPTGDRRGCMGCGCVVAIATLVSGLGGLAAVLLAVGV